MYLATRGNNKLLRTPPPHIGISEKILHHLTCRILAQIRTNRPTFLKSYPNLHTKSHPSPLCPLCNTHIHNTHHLLTISNVFNELCYNIVPHSDTELITRHDVIDNSRLWLSTLLPNPVPEKWPVIIRVNLFRRTKSNSTVLFYNLTLYNHYHE